MNTKQRVVFALIVFFASATSMAAIGVASAHPSLEYIADELAESRSVQKVLAYAVLALSSALAAVSGYVVKLLSDTVRQATATMTRCEERQRMLETMGD